MKLVDDHTGIELTLEYDVDGFPLVGVNILDGSYEDRNLRKTVEIKLNETIVYKMFDDEN